jgi:hypothetical protein
MLPFLPSVWTCSCGLMGSFTPQKCSRAKDSIRARNFPGVVLMLLCTLGESCYFQVHSCFSSCCASLRHGYTLHRSSPVLQRIRAYVFCVLVCDFHHISVTLPSSSHNLRSCHTCFTLICVLLCPLPLHVLQSLTVLSSLTSDASSGEINGNTDDTTVFERCHDVASPGSINLELAYHDKFRVVPCIHTCLRWNVASFQYHTISFKMSHLSPPTPPPPNPHRE